MSLPPFGCEEIGGTGATISFQRRDIDENVRKGLGEEFSCTGEYSSLSEAENSVFGELKSVKNCKRILHSPRAIFKRSDG